MQSQRSEALNPTFVRVAKRSSVAGTGRRVLRRHSNRAAQRLLEREAIVTADALAAPVSPLVALAETKLAASSTLASAVSDRRAMARLKADVSVSRTGRPKTSKSVAGAWGKLRPVLSWRPVAPRCKGGGDRAWPRRTSHLAGQRP